MTTCRWLILSTNRIGPKLTRRRRFPNSVPPFFASVDSLTNLSLTAPIFAEKAAKISEISTNALYSVVKLIP